MSGEKESAGQGADRGIRVYLKLRQAAKVQKREVTLGDVAEVFCDDPALCSSLLTLPVRCMEDRPQKYAGSVLEIVALIRRKVPRAEMVIIGGTDFLIDYRPPSAPGRLREWGKTIAVCAVCFTGAAFAIMTFNNDASVSDVFRELYRLVTGREAAGPTVLEAGYCLGLAAGILVFFNHFASWKLSADPTPLEVELMLYEENVTKTLIQNGEKERASGTRDKGKKEDSGRAS